MVGMDGFCKLLAKLFGPVQEYVALATVGVDRFKVAPSHKGPFVMALGVEIGVL